MILLNISVSQASSKQTFSSALQQPKADTTKTIKKNNNLEPDPLANNILTIKYKKALNTLKQFIPEDEHDKLSDPNFVNEYVFKIRKAERTPEISMYIQNIIDDLGIQYNSAESLLKNLHTIISLNTTHVEAREYAKYVRNNFNITIENTSDLSLIYTYIFKIGERKTKNDGYISEIIGDITYIDIDDMLHQVTKSGIKIEIIDFVTDRNDGVIKGNWHERRETASHIQKVKFDNLTKVTQFLNANTDYDAQGKTFSEVLEDIDNKENNNQIATIVVSQDHSTPSDTNRDEVHEDEKASPIVSTKTPAQKTKESYNEGVQILHQAFAGKCTPSECNQMMQMADALSIPIEIDLIPSNPHYYSKQWKIIISEEFKKGWQWFNTYTDMSKVTSTSTEEFLYYVDYLVYPGQKEYEQHTKYLTAMLDTSKTKVSAYDIQDAYDKGYKYLQDENMQKEFKSLQDSLGITITKFGDYSLLYNYYSQKPEIYNQKISLLKQVIQRGVTMNEQDLIDYFGRNVKKKTQYLHIIINHKNYNLTGKTLTSLFKEVHTKTFSDMIRDVAVEEEAKQQDDTK